MINTGILITFSLGKVVFPVLYASVMKIVLNLQSVESSTALLVSLIFLSETLSRKTT